MRYPASNKIFDCLIDVLKRFEAFMYFDENGKFTVEKLPGGLLSEPGASVGDFSRDPSKGYEYVILDEKNVETDFKSTINRISLITIDRDTREAIVYTHSPDAVSGAIPFLKVWMVDQPALGDLETARTWAGRMGDRMFYPILKTSFSAIASSKIIRPLNFINIDAQPFRCMGVSRKYDASTNDLSMEYNCEWLGGA